MLARSAVRAFLNRKLKSFEWLKDLSPKQLDGEVGAVMPPAHFHTQPWWHQKICFLIGVNRRQFLFLLDVGTGKTKVILDILHNRIFSGEVSRAIIAVPTKVLVDEWEEQAAIHQPTLKVVALRGTKQEKLKRMRRRHDLLIMTNGTLRSFCAIPREDRPTGRGGKPIKTVKSVVDKEATRAFFEKYQCIVYDEIHNLQNQSSITSLVARFLLDLVPYRYGLTGTPTGRDPADMWSEFYSIDGGATLGDTLTLFRQVFYEQKKGYWTKFVFKLKKELKPVLNRTLHHRSIVFDLQDCIDLPPLIRRVRKVSLPAEAEPYYKKVKEQLKAAHGERRLVEQAYIRARMISSGFLSVRDDTGAKGVVEFRENPKLDTLMSIILEAHKAHKIVVVHWFVWSGKRIAHELEKNGIGYAMINGQTDDPGAEKRRFVRSPKCRVCIINAKAGGAGLNLQVASYQVYYESPDSPKIRKQADRRVHRGGQDKKVMLVDLVTKGTADERILALIKQGKSMHDAVVSGRLEL